MTPQRAKYLLMVWILKKSDWTICAIQSLYSFKTTPFSRSLCVGHSSVWTSMQAKSTQIRDNIGMGAPEYADDDDKILEAARLGGADEIIRHLPQGLDTYLERPVSDVYSHLEGTTFRGRHVDFSNIKHRAGMDSSSSRSLSGGQLQRIALSVLYFPRMNTRDVTTNQSTVFHAFADPRICSRTSFIR